MRPGWPRHWRLATRVTVAVLILLLPLFLIVLVSYSRVADERRQSEVANAYLVGQAVAGIVDRFARDIESTLLAAAVAVGSRSDPINQTTVGPYLSALSADYGILRGLFITDLEGRVIASASGEGIGLDLAPRPYMQTLRGGAETVWGPGVSGIQSGEITVTYGRAIRDAVGRRRGFVVAAFYPSRLLEDFPSLHEDSDVTLIDQQGLILHSTGRPEISLENRNVRESERFQAALAGEMQMVFGESSIYGEERFGVIAPVRNNGWIVVFTRPLAPLEAELRSKFLQQAGGIAAIVLLAAGLLALVAQRLTRPIALLARTAGAIARGERPSIPNLDADEEVTQLAAGMRAMADAVAEREDALRNALADARRAEDEIRRHADRVAVLSDATRVFAELSVEPEEVLPVVARRVAEVIGDSCIVLLAERGELRLLALHHTNPDALAAMQKCLAGASIDVRAGFAGRVLETGEPLLIPSMSPDEARTAKMPQLQPYLESFAISSLLVVPLRVHGRVPGVLELWREELDRPYTEADLLMAQDLADRAALAIENARLFREARDAVRARDEFLSIAAHELKTPITSVKGLAQVLLRAGAREQLDEQRLSRGLRSIEQGSNRLASLVDDLLDVARIRTGQMPYDPVACDVRDLVRSAVDRYVDTIGGEHEIVLDLPPESCVAFVDPQRIDGVLVNLLENAIKYSPDGGLIRIAVSADDEGIVVAVQDQGIGLPLGSQTMIFEPFNRAPNAQHVSGMGLGLHICREVLARHGGRIWAESEGNERGTTVAFWVPAAPDPALVDQEPVADQSQSPALSP